MKENKLLINIDESQSLAINQLVQLGKQKGFITSEDILNIFDDTEMDHLEAAYTALLSAGIELKDSDSEGDMEETKQDRVSQDEPDSPPENVLDNIETSDLIGMYFKDAAGDPLLTAEEEVALAKRIERGRAARKELSTKQKRSQHIKQDLQELIDDGWLAVEILIRSNSRLVISIARKYVGRGVAFLDLIQEGNIGLMRAAKKFEYQRGFKFSTYATWWIRQAITRSLSDQGRTIRIPVHMGERISKMFRTQHELRQILGRNPEIEEIAKKLEVSPSRVRYMMRVAQYPLSLEMPTTHEGDSVLGDFIEDSESPDPDETATLNLLRQQLEQVFEQLPAREVRILKMRFGLIDGKKYTLREAGERMGVTRERIRQIEAQALQRLRQPHIKHKFRGYFRPS